jgi:hypothetical protein
MTDVVQPDSTIAAAAVVAAEQIGDTATTEAQGGADTTGTPLAQVAAQAQPDPANPTYLERLKAAGL